MDGHLSRDLSKIIISDHLIQYSIFSSLSLGLIADIDPGFSLFADRDSWLYNKP